jgi:hypothetical protein
VKNNTIIKLRKFGLHKKNGKNKLKLEEQRGKSKGNKLSGFQSRE